MANGDTKTEALLNILGNGGDASEYKGCCNTKTQQYILDAIERIENLQPGGGGGDATYYYAYGLATGTGTEFFYEDESRETPVSADDVFEAFQKGPVILVQPTSGDTAYSYIVAANKDTSMSANSYGFTIASPYNFSLFVTFYNGETGVYTTTIEESPTVVQTTGTSTTDVMSQNATTGMVFADPGTNTRVSIGNANAGASAISIGPSTYGAGEFSTAVGYQANTYGGTGAVALGQAARARSKNAVAIGYNVNQGGDGGQYSVAVGSEAKSSGWRGVSVGSTTTTNADASVAMGYNASVSSVAANGGVAIGVNAIVSQKGGVALGAGSNAVSQGEFNIGATTAYGYNSTTYRLLSGVHDGQGANDAVTVGQVNATIDAINAALNTSIPHIGASS